MPDSSVESKFRLSTHEKCSDPCPSFRARTEDHPAFEFKGFWGPYVETIDGTTVAQGHREVEQFLEDHGLTADD